eukprot:TRINITY_DN1955_c0_g1_i1.p1 TRINITY_DN1955_c0_g1~~TRINITY_DN1955_c0_g1_i1.p1  ORF type:complete len:348 (-),score=85.47 TRINITY_DN1955_c0_g1_i1:47-1090(-)
MNVKDDWVLQTGPEFGIVYEKALQQLTGLQMLEKSEKLDQELELLPQFAGLVPESITLDGFRDLISKMTPNILLHRNEAFKTCLHEMAESGNVTAVRALLAVGPENYREMIDKHHWNPLFLAVSENHVDCVKALLKDASPEYREIVDGTLWTPLHIAGHYGHADCGKALLKDSRPEYREMLNEDGFTALLVAAQFGEFDFVKVILKDSPPEFREISSNEDGWTPLYAAARYGYANCVKSLLEDSRPEYREMVDGNGSTALHMAARGNFLDCVQALLEDARPEYLEVINKDGKSAINMTPNETTCRILLRAKYIHKVLSNISRTLSILDGKDIFWSDDSTAKDTLLWF